MPRLAVPRPAPGQRTEQQQDRGDLSGVQRAKQRWPEDDERERQCRAPRAQSYPQLSGDDRDGAGKRRERRQVPRDESPGDGQQHKRCDEQQPGRGMWGMPEHATRRDRQVRILSGEQPVRRHRITAQVAAVLIGREAQNAKQNEQLNHNCAHDGHGVARSQTSGQGGPHADKSAHATSFSSLSPDGCHVPRGC